MELDFSLTGLPLDPDHDLLALRKRLAQLGEADSALLGDYRWRKDQKLHQTFLSRIGSLLSSLRRTTATRRRCEILDEAFERLLIEQEGRADLLANLINAWGEVLRAREDKVFGLFEERLLTFIAAQEKRDNVRNVEFAALANRFQFERGIRQKAFSDFDRALRVLKDRRTAVDTGFEPATTSQYQASPAEASLIESFYYLLEERYRGTREEIKQRLSIYRDDLLAARRRTGPGKIFIDIGCGRGEFLEVARELGFESVLGVDSNDTQLAVARARGLPVEHADALSFLRSQGEGSVLAVTGIHIVEHLPFPALLSLLQEIARVIHPNGVVIFETPNPRNLIVGATTFHLDPTHTRPLPPEVLSIALETVGFQKIETRLLHPSDTFAYMVKERDFDPDVAALLYGAQDYAVIASLQEEPCGSAF